MEMQDIANYRLANQHISGASAKRPADVVSSLCAMQAQDYLGALWAVGLRMKGATQADVEQAIARKEILRTWPMRGTLHFVSPKDVRWMLGLLPERAIPKRQKGNGLDDAILKRGEDALVKALRKRGQMTRNEIYRVLGNAGSSVLNNRDVQRHVIRRAGRDGLICFGPHDGKQPTFALLDEWAAKGKVPKREVALAELAKRYFTGHGPATLEDFVWWSGLKLSDARTGVEKASAELAQETFEGRKYWMPFDIEESGDVSPTAYLLPAFDEYLIGYKDRTAALHIAHSQRVVPGGNGMFLPIIVVDGRVVGTWKRAIGKDDVGIRLEPFARLNAAQYDAVAIAAERYGKFIGKQVVLRVR